jgi:hypothetical protein
MSSRDRAAASGAEQADSVLRECAQEFADKKLTSDGQSRPAARQAYDRSFAGRRFNWLQQILADRELQPFALHVAMALANKLHSKPGEQYFTAWLFQGTIAEALSVTDRSVRNAIAALVENGHLAVVQRGHHQSAIYRPLLKPDQTGTDFSVSEPDRNEFSGLSDLDRNGFSGLKPSDRKNHVTQTGTDFPTEEDYEEDDSREEDERATKPKVKDSIPKTRRRRPQTPSPQGFHLSAGLEEYASQTASWNRGRASAEFDRFMDYWRSKGVLFADWDAAWRNWVRKGAEIDKNNQLQAGVTIDNATGQPVATPPPNRPLPYRRESNTERLMRKLQGGA